MNKKQLIALINAIVIAVQNGSTEGGLETTEDEARTLVGMRLRALANEVVVHAAGLEDTEDATKREQAAALLKDAQRELAVLAQAKKDAKEAEAESTES
jgi:hypothetical protein